MVVCEDWQHIAYQRYSCGSIIGREIVVLYPLGLPLRFVALLHQVGYSGIGVVLVIIETVRFK